MHARRALTRPAARQPFQMRPLSCSILAPSSQPLLSSPMAALATDVAPSGLHYREHASRAANRPHSSHSPPPWPKPHFHPAMRPSHPRPRKGPQQSPLQYPAHLPHANGPSSPRLLLFQRTRRQRPPSQTAPRTQTLTSAHAPAHHPPHARTSIHATPLMPSPANEGHRTPPTLASQRLPQCGRGAWPARPALSLPMFAAPACPPSPSRSHARPLARSMCTPCASAPSPEKHAPATLICQHPVTQLAPLPAPHPRICCHPRTFDIACHGLHLQRILLWYNRRSM